MPGWLQGRFREGASSGDSTSTQLLLLQTPGQVRRALHRDPPVSRFATLADHVCGGVGVVPWFVPHPTGQRTDIPAAWSVLTCELRQGSAWEGRRQLGQLSGGQRVPTRSHLCSETEPGGSEPVWCLDCDSKAVDFWSRNHPPQPACLQRTTQRCWPGISGNALAKQGRVPDVCCCSGAWGHWKFPWAPRRWQEPVQALTPACWHGRNRTVSASSRPWLFFAEVFRPVPV